MAVSGAAHVSGSAAVVEVPVGGFSFVGVVGGALAHFVYTCERRSIIAFAAVCFCCDEVCFGEAREKVIAGSFGVVGIGAEGIYIFPERGCFVDLVAGLQGGWISVCVCYPVVTCVYGIAFGGDLAVGKCCCFIVHQEYEGGIANGEFGFAGKRRVSAKALEVRLGPFGDRAFFVTDKYGEQALAQAGVVQAVVDIVSIICGHEAAVRAAVVYHAAHTRFVVILVQEVQVSCVLVTDAGAGEQCLVCIELGGKHDLLIHLVLVIPQLRVVRYEVRFRRVDAEVCVIRCAVHIGWLLAALCRYGAATREVYFGQIVARRVGCSPAIVCLLFRKSIGSKTKIR